LLTKRRMPFLEQVFQAIDTTGDGMVEFSELEQSVQEINKLWLPSVLSRALEPSTLQIAFELMNDDCDGKVDLEEFARCIWACLHGCPSRDDAHIAIVAAAVQMCV